MNSEKSHYRPSHAHASSQSLSCHGGIDSGAEASFFYITSTTEIVQLQEVPLSSSLIGQATGVITSTTMRAQFPSGCLKDLWSQKRGSLTPCLLSITGRLGRGWWWCGGGGGVVGGGGDGGGGTGAQSAKKCNFTQISYRLFS